MIKAEYNRYGYTILLVPDGPITPANQVRELYYGGNCTMDSTSVVTPGEPGSVSLRVVRAYAIATARDYAKEFRQEYGGVERIADLEREEC